MGFNSGFKGLSNGHLQARTNTGLRKADSSMPTITDSHVTRAGRAGTIPNYVSGIHCFMRMKGFFAIRKGHRRDVRPENVTEYYDCLDRRMTVTGRN